MSSKKMEEMNTNEAKYEFIPKKPGQRPVFMGPVCDWPRREDDPIADDPKDPYAASRVYELLSLSEFTERFGFNPLTEVSPSPKQEEQSFPGFGEMAKNLVSSTTQLVTNGFAPEDIQKERIATCEGCPSFDGKSRRCMECGCFMDAKKKIAGDPSNLCPLNKWSK